MNEAERHAIREMLKRRSDEKTRTVELARQWLIDEGLYDNDGDLKPQYGGQPDKRIQK
ncbi:hypothetical protein LAV84_23605 [Rhizobium sp. VS19-DR104.2]|uniref:hypothetical protein n=1 Tax=unclassified Rhizobium TaxID=2613769 RepID=UPI001CC3C95C|nr:MULTISPECIES: hypothetical protein [unclassified Rhizobium]MBZ5762247.1 hypothetical protein [Rhizobium sp. VS19-DR96]MBZ5768263.1 hypothetical protein [Rhizobium sp. VS19-DR129.2]MBZ5775865.1 hypothetical protein [Rhizobium sp. VS19-DRK62.2]MBZ5787114.1 hypothetical protein [Rhizobium sp. VS19-DR121]MBZ5804188.1 hypothetical protein [Rhizobium sp. VS19-DR181]